VIVIANGLIVAEGPPASLAGRDQMRTRIRFRLPETGPHPDGPVRRLADGSLEIDVDATDTTKAVHDLTGWALDRGVVLESLEITQPSLEDVYLQLTGAEVGT
jgi:ABC-2 type transport system ATP-binding protein